MVECFSLPYINNVFTNKKIKEQARPDKYKALPSNAVEKCVHFMAELQEIYKLVASLS